MCVFVCVCVCVCVHISFTEGKRNRIRESEIDRVNWNSKGFEVEL